MLFSSYRRADANDPDGYVASIAAVLSLYDTDLMREVTDPRTGIQTTQRFETFLPNVGELKRYCDAIADHRVRIQKLAELPPKPVPVARRLSYDADRSGMYANGFVPQTNSRYLSLAEWAKTADPRMFRFGVSADNRPGIWVCHEVILERRDLGGGALPPIAPSS